MSLPLHELARQYERASADDMVEFASWVSVNDPDRGAASAPLAGGHVVLTGRGLFVNAAMACGFDGPLDDADLDTLEALAAQTGVTPTVQVSELTDPQVAVLLAERGYRPDGDVAGVVHDLGNVTVTEPEPLFGFAQATTESQLAQWQQAAAQGWGHGAPERQLASDTFAAAAHATQAPGLLLVHDKEDGRVVGCTALSIRDGVAILGGMSTIPAERNRGVQRACIEHRLQLAVSAGCAVAATQAEPDGGSLRNLLRAGFTQSHITTNWVRTPSAR